MEGNGIELTTKFETGKIDKPFKKKACSLGMCKKPFRKKEVK